VGSSVGGDSASKPRITFRQVLSRRDFFRVWLSQGISYIGDRLTQVALMIFVLELAQGSAAAVGWFMVSQSLPVILLGPIAGVLVDRWDKRKAMVVCDLLRAAIIATVPFLGDARFVYLAGFLMSAVSAVFSPALNASIPELVEGKSEILVANSLLFSTKYFTDFLGFGLAGLIVAVAGLKVAFLVDALTFIGSALCLVGVTKRLVVGQPRPIDLAGFWADLKAGIRYHRENAVVLSLLISFAAGVLAMGGFNTLLVVAVKKLLQVSEFWWGFMLCAQAVTMFATVAAIGRWGQKVPRPYLILPGFLGIGLGAMGLALATNLPQAFVLYALIGVANSLFLVPSMSWIQEIVPFEFRGRVFSLRGMALNLAAIISYGAVGPLADEFGVSKVMFGIGVLLCVITALSSALPGYREVYRRRPPAQAAA